MNETTTPTKPRRRFKWLRVAVSAFFVLLSLALIALWVRSYWWLEIVRGPLTNSAWVNAMSDEGWFTLRWARPPPPRDAEWSLYRISIERREQQRASALALGNTIVPLGRKFGFRSSPGRLQFPYWFLVTLSATFASAPWLPWQRFRFSLRTMLLAVAVLAVLLGWWLIWL